MDKGYLQIYTGNGKGKTTAALGQAVRAAGSGLKILFVQFMKNFPYGELLIAEKYKDQIFIDRYGADDFVFRKEPPSDKLIDEVKNGLQKSFEKMNSGEYDIVVLDEVNVSIYFGLLEETEALDFIRKRPDNVELILTGRYCPESLIKEADLVTEMKEIKHYYQNGIMARKGIES